MGQETEAGKVTLFGGSGFIGRHIVQELANRGWQIQSVSRHPKSAEFLKSFGKEGQISVGQVDLREENSVFAALEGSDLVINLVAILYETRSQKFEDLHYEAAKKVAEAASKSGVRQLIHFSSIGVDEKSEALYASTKARGEKAVHRAFPAATILRPSVVFGPEDQLFNRFAQMAKLSPFLPLIGGGKSKFQPVYVGDLAKAVGQLAGNSTGDQRIYELGGPDVVSFKEMLQIMLGILGKRRFLVPLPFWYGSLIATFLQLLPNKPLTADQVKMLKSDNVVSPDADGFQELGISPAAIEEIVPGYLC